MVTVVLLLKSLQPHTGNNSTIERLRSYFCPPEYNCLITGANAYNNYTDYNNFLLDHQADIVIGIHAYHAGRLLTHSPVPTIIIFGGTDLNEFIGDIGKMNIMTKAIRKASTLVAFNSALEKKCQAFWPELPMEKVMHIPQAVVTTPTQKFKIIDYLYSNNLLHCSGPVKLLTLVAGIRPVKDPGFLLSTFSKWHCQNKEFILLIIGPIIDKEYATKFKARICDKPGVIFLSGLPIDRVHATIQDSFAVVNSSISEGMSTALLEAMHLGTLVLARDIEGNRALVKNHENGLTFESPEDFISCLNYVIAHPSDRKTMIDKARRTVRLNHCCERERKEYLSVVNELARQK